MEWRAVLTHLLFDLLNVCGHLLSDLLNVCVALRCIALRVPRRALTGTGIYAPHWHGRFEDLGLRTPPVLSKPSSVDLFRRYIPVLVQGKIAARKQVRNTRTVRGAWCVVRGAWYVVRGAWCVLWGVSCELCGAWCVVYRV